MIAVDTNVLMRWLLDDDPLQSAKAARLFDTNDEILITDVVLAEAIWVLAGRKYRLERPAIGEVVTGLLEDSRLMFESHAVVWAALQDYSGAADHSSPDFADSLIVNKAKATAALRERPYRGTYTFDEAAMALDGMAPL